MRELNDQDFDKAFKNRITEELPEYEEESWLKMEQKLRKKDRFIFYRNASIILLFLSFGLGFYFITKQGKVKSNEDFAVNKKIEPTNQPQGAADLANSGTKVATRTGAIIAKADETPKEQQEPLKKVNQQTIGKPLQKIDPKTSYATVTSTKHIQTEFSAPPYKTTDPQEIVNQKLATTDQQTIAQNAITQQNGGVEPQKPAEMTTALNLADNIVDSLKKKPVIAKIKRKIPISLAISAGPDFNSTSNLIGGKSSVALGISVGVGISKKLSIHTGIGFGMKNYNASASDYTFTVTNPSNPYGPGTPAFQSTIAQINAACKVLEVPLLASYTLSNNQKRSISFNAGLSSYFMLKEEYIYKYTAASGKNDRVNEYTNANQHILSVVNLSATYNFKLKRKNLGFGIEPYVKIPLTGIGEGSVPLKSSGVAFKLQYDWNKK